MSERKPDKLIASLDEPSEKSPLHLSEDKLEIFGGTVERHINELQRRHMETAQALKRTIKAQHALDETMDSIVILLQDPEKTAEEAIKQLADLFKLKKNLDAERERLEKAYKDQEREYAAIQDEMDRLAKEHPEAFILGEAADA